MAVDELFKPVTLLRYQLGDVQYSATGIFYETDQTTFLVTNKHVLEHEHGISPEEIEVYIRDESNPDTTTRVPESTSDEKGNPRWLTHPEYSNADVSALELQDINLDETGNSSYSESDLITPAEEEGITGGTDAMVAGYPSPGDYPIRDHDTSSPVLVNALISSSFGDHFDGEPFFLIDATTYNGMSGSPVLLRSNRMLTKDTPTGVELSIEMPTPKDLLGIHSGPYEVSGDLSLNRVWYAEIIDEITKLEE